MAPYLHALQEGGLLPDEFQRSVALELQSVNDQLVMREARATTGWARLRTTLLGEEVRPIKGLYLWGGVGRGKTFMMDLFFNSLPLKRKTRLHFHRFMQMVHARLRAASGQPNPLTRVAEEIAEGTAVLCFDEFYVSDIGDAMILANLLEVLFARGVVLIATSNLRPDLLYENGLQRKKFLPAIELLKRHTKVVNVDGGTDYRLRSLNKNALYHYPPGPGSASLMAELFRDLTRGSEVIAEKVLQIQDRKINCRSWSEGVVWFGFEQLCTGPRGVADYVELASLYHTVLISSVPAFRGVNDDEARRFIALVDEFYDHKVKLALEADTAIETLYQAGDLAFIFERTRSRLIEMQSPQYLALQHEPG